MAEFCIHEEHGGICEKLGTYCNLGACPYEDLVEYAPVKRGRWGRIYKSGVKVDEGVVSSCCDMWNERRSHYCPNCGANMDGGNYEQKY